MRLAKMTEEKDWIWHWRWPNKEKLLSWNKLNYLFYMFSCLHTVKFKKDGYGANGLTVTGFI